MVIAKRAKKADTFMPCLKISLCILCGISFFILLFMMPAVSFAQSPDDPVFDLRDYYGDGTADYPTAVRDQS
jgi:hypothetical protein